LYSCKAARIILERQDKNAAMTEENTVIFREVQRFRQAWVWALLISIATIELATFGYGIIQQIILGKPFGNNPTSDAVLIIIAIPAILIGVGLLLLFGIIKLETDVRQDGLYVRFFPLHLSYKRIPLEDVERMEACTYRPILEYGGWGIRFRRGGKAYNISGNRGVRLDFSNGRRLLIGSQKSEELAAAIESIWKRQM